jgi:predicted ATPase/DNA-binding SARP family transcriptional activator
VIFGILGQVEVRLPDGTPVSVGGPSVRALLALLLLDAGRIVPTERLIDGVYGEDPPPGAGKALQSHVSRLRRSLRQHGGAEELVEFHPAGYRMAVDPESVDAHRFERLVADGRRAFAAGKHPHAAEVLGEAVGLWRGPALADVPHARSRATRLEELRVAAIEDHVEAELAVGARRAVIPELRALIAAHPLRERPRGLLMRALYGCGRAAEALEVYADLRRVLADEIGADPSPELAAVHLAVLRNDASLAPTKPEPSVRAPAPPGLAALPGRLTSFVGRELELARIAELSEARLITLTGPGGTGKTRLAVEAAARSDEEVCFVDLSHATDEAALTHVVAIGLGLRAPTGLTSSPSTADPTERITAALAERRLLLILDNCEHLLDAAARFTDHVLAACPSVRVLATSREPLGITGETLCPVPQLALPGPDTDIDALRAVPAVRLFVERGAAVRPGFAVTEQTAPVITRICAALDGLPLAIELAAARLRTLPVTEVAARLDDRFRLLSRGSRTAAPRHRTLHAVVEWSWDLLDPDERVFARRLTVFAGGATPAAAAVVCGVDVEEADDLLTGLTDKSLVTMVEGEAGAGPRFIMLETVRAFGAERLAEADEAMRLRRAHAEYFLGVATEAESELRGRDQLVALARLGSESANTDAALRWATRADPDLALRLHAALTWSWWLVGRRDSAVRSAELFAAVGPRAPDGLEEEYVLCVANVAACPSGHDSLSPAAIEDALDEAGAIMGRLHRRLRHPTLIVQWALVGGPERAPYDAHAAQAGDDPWCAAVGLIGIGYRKVFTGDSAGALGPITAAVEGFRTIGDRWGLANALEPLAQLAEGRGETDRAIELLTEATDLATELGSTEDLIDFLCARADLDLRGGRPDAARAGFARAEAEARRTGVPAKVRGALRGLGDVARLRGDRVAAERLYGQVLYGDEESAAWAQETRALALLGLGRLAAAGGDLATARERQRAAMTAALTPPPHARAAAAATEALAEIAALEGDGSRAALLLGAATAILGGTRHGPDRAAAEAAARALVGNAEFARAHERGSALTWEDALREAGA